MTTAPRWSFMKPPEPSGIIAPAAVPTPRPMTRIPRLESSGIRSLQSSSVASPSLRMMRKRSAAEPLPKASSEASISCR